MKRRKLIKDVVIALAGFGFYHNAVAAGGLVTVILIVFLAVVLLAIVES